MTNPEPSIQISITDREAQILSDAIRFIWKSGAVTSREGGIELMGLEDRISGAITELKDAKYGHRGETETAS